MPRRRWVSRLSWGLLSLVLLAGSAAITLASLVYFGDELAPFVLEKLPLPDEELWTLALRVHVVAAAVCLPGCLVLSSTSIMRRAPRVHRWLGRLVGALVLLALVPSGFYLSLFAKGGLPSTLGFVLSGAIVAVAMILGVRAARARRFAAHRRAVWHVLAQLAVAVASRAMLFALDALAVDEIAAYLLSLWLPVLGSFALVEILSTRTKTPPLDWRKPDDAPRPDRPRSLDLRPDVARRAA